MPTWLAVALALCGVVAVSLSIYAARVGIDQEDSNQP